MYAGHERCVTQGDRTTTPRRGVHERTAIRGGREIANVPPKGRHRTKPPARGHQWHSVSALAEGTVHMLLCHRAAAIGVTT